MSAGARGSPTPASGSVPLPKLGVLVPLVTPLLPDGAVDGESFRVLIDFQVRAGVDGLLVLGSSGEAVALSAAERAFAAAIAVEHARGRTHLMIGVATHGTKDAATEAAVLADLGPDSLLVAAPAGFALSQPELATHFRAVGQSCDTPLVAYEAPTRVGVSLGAELVASLGAEGSIAGLKDSSGDLVKGRVMSEATSDLAGFVRYTGCEHCIDGAMLAGYNGAIAGLANVFPEFHVELVRRVALGDWAGASQVQGYLISLLELYDYSFAGASFSAQFFAVVKEALRQRGVIAHGTISAPMTPADDGLPAHCERMLRRGAELADRLAADHIAEPVSP
jgi:4-hydroxy-tetrahydrodipicolinate synthase